MVARADLGSVTDDLARRLAAKAPSVLRTTKRQVQDAAEEMASTRIGWHGADLLAAALADPEARAAARRYLDQR